MSSTVRIGKVEGLADRSVTDLVALITEATAELTGRVPPDSPAACMDLAAALAAVTDRAEAVIAQLVDRVHMAGQAREAGYPSTSAWLRSGCGMRGGDAVDRVRVSTQLPRLPETTKRFTAGELSYGFVKTITETVAHLSDADTGAAERLMLDWVAEGYTAQQLARCGRQIRDRIRARDDTEPAPEDARRGYERSWLRLAAGMDGGGYLDGYLNAEDAALWRSVLEPLSRPTGETDDRDHAQRLADAAHTVFTGGRHYAMTVVMDWTTFNHHTRPCGTGPDSDHGHDPDQAGTRGWGPGPDDVGGHDAGEGFGFPPGARLLNGAPISTERARQLALNAGISLLILGPEGLPLYLGRSVRLVTTGQRRALEALYQTCAVSDCDIPAELCEIDHVTGWVEGGRTDIDQLAPLCGFHNRFKAAHPARIHIQWRTGHWQYTVTHTHNPPLRC